MERSPEVEEPDSESDLHIEDITVEELSLSEVRSGAGQWNSKEKKSLSAVALGLNQSTSSPVYGSVSVNSSENVQFGNNTYFNAPVVIKQIVHSKSGFDNASYTKTEDRNEFCADSPSPKPSQDTERKIDLKTWHKLALATASLAVIAAVISTALIFRNTNQKITGEEYIDDYSNDSITDPLQIAPFHLRLVDRAQWLAQPVEDKLDLLELPTPWVVITHTAAASCSTQSECVYLVRLIQLFHVESRKWSDIGYHFLVGGDGSAYVARGWDHVGAHTLGYNNFSISIAFIGTFNKEKPARRQVEACRKLLELGVKLGKLAADYKLFGHRQLMSTLSPGDQVYNIISKWPHFTYNVTAALPKGHTGLIGG